MTDFFEVDEKQKTVKILNLEDFSIEDLKNYISELENARSNIQNFTEEELKYYEEKQKQEEQQEKDRLEKQNYIDNLHFKNYERINNIMLK